MAETRPTQLELLKTFDCRKIHHNFAHRREVAILCISAPSAEKEIHKAHRDISSRTISAGCRKVAFSILPVSTGSAATRDCTSCETGPIINDWAKDSVWSTKLAMEDM